MALPTNRIKKVKLGDSTTYEIIPESLQKDGHKASLPALTGDATIATTADLPTKQSLGLGNVDNTSDLNKPISTATQTALNGKQATLVSGTNIKTINNQSILGSGNISIPADTNTWRPIKVNGAQVKSSDVSSGAINFSSASDDIINIQNNGDNIYFSAGPLSRYTDTKINVPYVYSQISMATNGHMIIHDWEDDFDAYPTVRPTNSTGLSDPSTYVYGTGITVHGWGDSDTDIALSYPSQGGVLGLQIDIDDLTQANS